VLPNLLTGFRIVDPLCVRTRCIPDNIRPLAQCATHGVISNTLRQQLQLALDLGKPLHVNVELHCLPPEIPTEVITLRLGKYDAVVGSELCLCDPDRKDNLSLKFWFLNCQRGG